MQVLINGQEQQVGEASTLSSLLTDLGYQEMLVAVAVNRVCIPRTERSAVRVKAGDDIEILAPMAGG